MRVTAALVATGGAGVRRTRIADGHSSGERRHHRHRRLWPAIGLGARHVERLCVGFWTGGAATSFRKIAETKNEVWHLMNAVGSLRAMYGLLRTIIYATLVLSVISLGMLTFGMMK